MPRHALHACGISVRRIIRYVLPAAGGVSPELANTYPLGFAYLSGAGNFLPAAPATIIFYFLSGILFLRLVCYD